jgi:uncharacterized membrane protein YhaH (DUF805 family)
VDCLKNLYLKRLGVAGYWLSFFILGLIIAPFSQPISTLASDYFLIRMILTIFVLFGVCSIIVRRLHDLNKSAFFGLLLFIPLVDIFIGIYLGFFLGSRGKNNFGLADKLIKQIFPF